MLVTSEVVPVPELTVLLGDNVVNKYVFDKDIISIGRARDNDVVIENLAVSRNHCRIRRKDDTYYLTDLNSANGTEVNGVVITKTQLENDDVVTIGKHRIVFKHEAMTDEALISDAFGAERTMIVDQVPIAYLVVTQGKQKDLEFRIDKSEVTIGRGGESDLSLSDWFIAKKHAVICRKGNSFLLRDAGSWRGTKVNEIQVTETILQDGDEIQVGGTALRFSLAPTGETSRATGRVPLELGPSDSIMADRLEPPKPGEQEWEEGPIRAGSEDDYIETSPSGPDVAEEVSVQGEFDDLEGELRESAEALSAAIGTEKPKYVSPGSLTPEHPESEPEAPVDADIETAPDEDTDHYAVEAIFGPEQEAGLDDVMVESEEVSDEEVAEFSPPPEAEVEPSEPAAEEPETQAVAEPEPAEAPAAEDQPAKNEDLLWYELEPEPEPQPAPEPEPAASSPEEEKPPADESAGQEIRMWEDALKNQSPVIRKQAAKMLKKLTGQDYDY
jgi:pSer/pThr/pTyr-binding forkhead associated (FHA) protein